MGFINRQVLYVQQNLLQLADTSGGGKDFLKFYFVSASNPCRCRRIRSVTHRFDLIWHVLQPERICLFNFILRWFIHLCFNAKVKTSYCSPNTVYIRVGKPIWIHVEFDGLYLVFILVISLSFCICNLIESQSVCVTSAYLNRLAWLLTSKDFAEFCRRNLKTFLVRSFLPCCVSSSSPNVYLHWTFFKCAPSEQDQDVLQLYAINWTSSQPQTIEIIHRRSWYSPLLQPLIFSRLQSVSIWFFNRYITIMLMS